MTLLKYEIKSLGVMSIKLGLYEITKRPLSFIDNGTRMAIYIKHDNQTKWLQYGLINMTDSIILTILKQHYNDA